MAEINLSELTFENIGSWPAPVKIIVIIVIFVGIILGAYLLQFQDQWKELDSLEKKEIELRENLEIKQQRAASLPLYKEQLALMNEKFGALLRKLPTKTEIPGLLEDISKIGVRSGLHFRLFDPMPSVEHDFYVEVPIQISVEGSYHQLATFISKIAALNRIVTLHDLKIVHIEAKEKPNAHKILLVKHNILNKRLVMDVTAKIYRYQGAN